VKIGPVTVGGGQPLALIAGPCVIEDEAATLDLAAEIAEIARRVGFPFIFKASFDKANRTSLNSFRGPGVEKGLTVLARVREAVGCPILSDVHTLEQVEPAAEVLDVLQIPAFLCRQTDLLQAAGRSGKPVNVKKGQFLAPWDMSHAIEKVRATGNENVLVTERGTCFGYNNLVSDFRSLVILRRFQVPVVFDGTHSVQTPGGQGASSGGQREFVAPLLRAAVAVGCDALFLEVHPTPDQALSDGPNMLPLQALESVLTAAQRIDRAGRAD
jgi:2-dehydro-3-deoxyphosphooctonate aldolase (KDO 8-P synthase)